MHEDMEKATNHTLQNQYVFETLVKDTVSILDALDIEKSHFMGYSFGGRVGLGIAKYTPNRFSSLIIGGAGAVELDSAEEIKRNQAQISKVKKGVEPLKQLMIDAGLSASEASIRVANTDWDAMIAINMNQEHLGFDEYLPSLKLQCLFFIGENDSRYSSAKRTAGMIENAMFVSLPGLNHAQAFRQSHLILPQIQEFLAENNQ